MEIQPINLFREGQLPSQSGFCGQWPAIKQHAQQAPVYLNLFANGLTQIEPTFNTKTSIEFDYDLKFSFTFDPPQIIFERANETCAYEFQSQKDVQDWRGILKDKLNQRGFHEQFKAISKIGKGNFATVYLVKKFQNKQHYAVKAFSKEQAYSEDNGKECLIKEIEIMRKCNHSNLMKLQEVFETQNSLYVVFEFLSGGQLGAKVEQKYKFKPNETKAIVYGILKGLRQLHAKNIMHRDLKPENLLFRSEGDYDCVIADFGLAEEADADKYLFVRCGTPGYVAPQVINIKDLKAKYHPICDMFSLGLIFYLLLFGKSAFLGKTYDQILAQNRASNIVIKEEDKKKGDAQSIDLLMKLLQKKPELRITAEQALKHPYFSQIHHQPIEPQKIEEESEPQQFEGNQRLDSPLLTTANKERKLNKKIKKDSCVDFRMGKQNIITGKTDPIGPLNSKTNKHSFVGTNSPMTRSRHSKFKRN